MSILSNVYLLLGISFLIYVLASYALLKIPIYWHQFPPLSFRAQNVAHRAGAGESLENTLGGVLKCVCAGCDMVQLDCRLTADNKVVCAHEDSLLRVAGVKKYISKLSYDELPLLKKRIISENNEEIVSPEAENDDDRRIPLLEEVFQAVRYLPINLYVRQSELGLIKQISDLVMEYERDQTTVWGNESEEVNQLLYKTNPKILLFFSVERAVRLLFLFYTGLLPFVSLKERVLEIPVLSTLYDHPAVVKRFGYFARPILAVANWFLMSPVLFDHLNRRKIQVYMWVLNTEEEYKQAFDLGATAAVTDYPTKLSEYLKKNEPPILVQYPNIEAVLAGLDLAREEVAGFYK